MNSIKFTPFPKLTTERLKLRKIIDDDLNKFFILKSDERLLKGYDAKAKTYEEARQFLQKLNNGILQNEWIIWGISLKNDDKLIESICFWNISKEQSKAEIGYELMVPSHGKGIMQKAVKAVIDYGFNCMKIQSIEAVPNPNNIKSIRLLEKNNFIRGADFTENDPVDGKILKRSYYLLMNTNHNKHLIHAIH